MADEDTSPAAERYSEHPLAALYSRSVLDPIVELALAISNDSVKRPRHYRDVPENVAEILQNFRFRTGSDPEWPSADQRAQRFSGVFDDAFNTLSMDLMSAAVAHAERAPERGADALDNRVRDAALTLRGHLRAVDRRLASVADRETGSIFQSAIEVLRSSEVAGVFGLSKAPGGDWPMDEATRADTVASDGATLIEQIQKALGFEPRITAHLFLLMQMTAYYGSMTIAAVLEDEPNWNRSDRLRALVRAAYGWHKALASSLSYVGDEGKGLQPRVVSQYPLEDEELRSLPTEEDAKRYGAIFQQAPGGGGKKNTCTYGWTRICDNPGPGQSCTYGWTWYCDTGPTCTSGWTLVCDTGPTCTYGWTLKCDKPAGL